MSVETAKNDLESLRFQIEETEARLSALKQQALKIAHFLEMTEIYSTDSTLLDPNNANTLKPIRTRSKGGRPSANGAPPKNVREAIAIIKERGAPVKTKELVIELEKRGIKIGGNIPITNLSSALSRFKELLASDRSEGWRLREWDNSPIAPQNNSEENVTGEFVQDAINDTLPNPPKRIRPVFAVS